MVASLGLADYELIATALHPQVPRPLLCQMLSFNDDVARQLGGSAVGEFNLRDVLRWCELMVQAEEGREEGGAPTGKGGWG